MEKPEFAKLLHSEVHYSHPSRRRDADGKAETCRKCRHFIADGHPENGERFAPRCEGVRSPIRAEDSCDKFEKKREPSIMSKLAKRSGN